MNLIAEIPMRPADRREEETMHLFHADPREEEALCGADTSADRRRSMGGYLEDRLNEVGVGTVCEECKVRGVRWTENRILKLEADAGELRDSADELERTAMGCQADGNAARYRNSAERRLSEADGLEDEARELRRLVERLKVEIGMDVHGR